MNKDSETKENCSRCATTHSESEGCIDQSCPTPPETKCERAEISGCKCRPPCSECYRVTPPETSSWENSARTKIKDIIEHPLLEYHSTEGHERPRQCVDGDVEAILEICRSVASSEYKRGVEDAITKTGFLRQWLNERTENKLITDEELQTFLKIGADTLITKPNDKPNN